MEKQHDTLKSIAAAWHIGRLTDLRSELKKKGVTGIIIPRWGHQQFEYVAPYEERLAWATGFSGSWGVALITLDRAVLFVDGRYTVQADQEVNDAYFEHRHLYDFSPTKWIEQEGRAGEVYAYDPAILTPTLYEELHQSAQKSNVILKAMWDNPIDRAWQEQPEKPLGKALVFDVKTAGLTSLEKRATLGEEMTRNDLDFLVEAQPDNVNWVFNIRGTDLPYSPMVEARAILHKNGSADLFLDKCKIDSHANYEF